jgi:hypothetical protein
MKKFVLMFLLTAAICCASDVHFTWLLAFNTVPGLPAPAAPQYGAQVFMDSDNPNVTEFQITVVAQMPGGEIVTKTGSVARESKVANVLYSTSYIAWLGPNPNFQVLSIQVKAVVAKNVTKPFPGRDYANDSAVPVVTESTGNL